MDAKSSKFKVILIKTLILKSFCKFQKYHIHIAIDINKGNNLQKQFSNLYSKRLFWQNAKQSRHCLTNKITQ